MALNRVSLSSAALLRMVGGTTFMRGQAYARGGSVTSAQWVIEGHRAVGTVRGNAPQPYDVTITVRCRDDRLLAFEGDCSCPVGVDCKHAVALALTLLDGDDGPDARPTPQSRAWEVPLRDLLAVEQPVGEASVALVFEVSDAPASMPRPGPVAARARRRIGMRPAVRSRNGGWVRGGISWQSLAYRWGPTPQLPAEQLRLMQEIAALETSGTGYYYGGANRLIYLDDIRGRGAWELFAEAVAAGIPLVQGPKGGSPVILATEPARVVLELTRDEGELLLQPAASVGDVPIPLDAVELLGDPPHGLAWWAPEDEQTLRLAALADRLDPVVLRVVERSCLRVPAGDEADFFARYFPALIQRVPLVAVDPSVELPRQQPPVLVLAVEHEPAGDRLDLRWQWRYQVGTAARLEPLWAPGGGTRSRDVEQENVVLKAVTEVVEHVPQLYGEPAGRTTEARLREVATLRGLDAVRFLSDALPRLEELPDVVVEATVPLRPLREAQSAPELSVSAEPAEHSRDWFDLSVTVTIDEEDVPFDQLFVALATHQPYLVLPSGTWFTLDRPELAALADLIEEARALNDPGSSTVRVSRYQNDLWTELERLGVVDQQAAGWRAAVASLAAAETLPAVPLPAGLDATLRPYQQEGFAWLATLHEHGLGGLLADEMGLGKTVQTIALVCHAKELSAEAGTPGRPFLVVAPTSVVHNWAAECRRFAPHLEVRVVNETARRTGTSIAAATSGADIVVTSYALFRIDYDDYEAVEWAGLVLDEAQFVKNPQSRGYGCAKRLPAPIKLAITGTPMENNLTELWSLLSITAPGLFPHPKGFEEHFRQPIERQRDAERLALLRRRIKPFMLRRTKEQVAVDLPPKQEQVIELPLHPRHRRIYQTHLQRERQKVLGLLGDLEKNRFEIFRSLTLLRQACLDPALIDPAYAGAPATKLDALMELLTEIVSEGHRTLVFSQFTRFLDSARKRLDAAGIGYCYLDGTTKRRGEVIEQFRSGDAPVFLISLKAGGFGLTLTEADYCILLDPWWNPATENQAVDRAHRIGQTRSVMVYRLVAEDTIEEKVMALKARKAALFASVLSADGAAAAGKLTAADIRSILE